MTATDNKSSFWQRWMCRPQSTWIRKATFQVHLWAGIVLGVYIVVVCVSGSAIVFRNDIYSLFESWTKAGATGWRAESMHFGYIALRWLSDLHGKLLLGSDGMMVNAIGGFLTVALSVTGLIVWWPGSGKWRRALRAQLRPSRTGAITAANDSYSFDNNESNGMGRAGNTGNVNWKRFNFDLHSAVGFWTFGILVVWGLTGGYFVFPEPFRAVINTFAPINAPRLPQPVIATQATQQPGAPQSSPAPVRRQRRPLTTGGKILRGFSSAHYGNFGGWPVKALYVIFGFAPAILFGTALVMWWNRVLSPLAKRWKRVWERAPQTAEFPSGEMGD